MGKQSGFQKEVVEKALGAGANKPQVQVELIETRSKAEISANDGRQSTGFLGEAGVALNEIPLVSDVQSRALLLEDEFANLYFTTDNKKGVVLAPPFDFRQLRRLVQENNTLLQAVTAMEVSTDGTGFDVVRKDGEDVKDNDSDFNKLDSFLKEPWPGVSFLTMRREIRRDLEEVGNAYLEVLRTPSDDIAFIRRVDPTGLRLIRLDEPTPVKVTLERDGKDVTIEMGIRERRFCQVVSNKTVYFRAFGTSRDVDIRNGNWAPDGERLGAAERGTELIHMKIFDHPDTPYGVPRWINQTPSVTGSRQAEELNLDFFDSGGIPPVLIMLLGGTMAEESRKKLERLMNGGDPARVAIADIQSDSGSLEGTGQVKTQVERFGSEKQTDSQFEKYLDQTRDRIANAFRLPPLFFGRVESFNFATAFASVLVTEAQVFRPERQEFDEQMNLGFIPALGVKEHIIRSKPLTVQDVTTQLDAIQIASNRGALDNEELVRNLNLATDLDMVPSEDLELVNDFDVPGRPDNVESAEDEALAAAEPATDGDTDLAKTPAQGTPKPPAQAGAKDREKGQRRFKVGTKMAQWRRVKDPAMVGTLAQEYLAAMEKDDLATPEGAERMGKIRSKMKGMTQQEQALFRVVVSAHLYPEYKEKDEELERLCAHAIEVTSGGVAEPDDVPEAG